MHDLRKSMYGQKICAQPRDAFHACRDRVADVMKLEIEKDPLARLHELWRVIEAAGKGELISDLVERDAIAEARHHALRGVHRRHLERHTQEIAKLHPVFLGTSSCSINQAGELYQPAHG